MSPSRIRSGLSARPRRRGTRPADNTHKREKEIQMKKQLNDAERNLSLSSRGARRRADHRIGKHKAPSCSTSGQARYARREQAQDVVQGLRWRESRRVQAGAEPAGVDWYSFPCVSCNNGWHVVRLVKPTVETDSSVICEPLGPSPMEREDAIHAIDFENLFLGGGATFDEVAALWGVYRQQGPGIAPNDLVIVAASVAVAVKFAEVITGPNVRWALGSSGPDGADHALLRAINVRRHSTQYGVLYVGSGDHIFTSLVQEARKFGMKVRVITTERPGLRSPLSRELKATGVPLIRIRTTSRELARRNREAISLVASRSHRRIHVETVAA